MSGLARAASKPLSRFTDRDRSRVGLPNPTHTYDYDPMPLARRRPADAIAGGFESSSGATCRSRSRLTHGEFEERREAVQNLTAEGMSVREIAPILGVSSSTVGTDVQNLTEQQDSKADRRATREAELAAKQKSLPEKRYGVIYAAPPWGFEPRHGKNILFWCDGRCNTQLL
jgi:DNA-binding CsgD family transcriptional regulator